MKVEDVTVAEFPALLCITRLNDGGARLDSSFLLFLGVFAVELALIERFVWVLFSSQLLSLLKLPEVFRVILLGIICVDHVSVQINDTLFLQGPEISFLLLLILINY